MTKKLCVFFVVLCLAEGSFFCGNVFAADETAWTLNVLAIPPDDGWESEAGLSIQRTLLWHQFEVAEKGEGMRGHDLKFIFLPPTDEDSVQNYVLPTTKQTVAVLSFASYPVDRRLVEKFSKNGVPLLLAGGENVSLVEQGRLLPSVFALDLFRDYRCRAFVDYASKILDPKARVGIIGARLTLHEEQEARTCTNLFMDAGFMPRTYWTDASARDSFAMVEQEIRNFSDGVLVSCVGGMASKEMWQGIMRYQSPYRLWYSGVPDKSFLSFRGMLFADQNFSLGKRGEFDALRRSLWVSRALAVPDKVAAGRANALAFWLTTALKASQGGFTGGKVLPQLAKVRDIPFGDQLLSIDETTHRPYRRRVYILEVRERSFFVRDVLDVEGINRYDY